jgi:hypothetical protein
LSRWLTDNAYKQIFLKNESIFSQPDKYFQYLLKSRIYVFKPLFFLIFAIFKKCYAAGAQTGFCICEHYGLDGNFTVFAVLIGPGLGLFWTFINVLFSIPFFQ